jgi:hypothetical protein
MTSRAPLPLVLAGPVLRRLEPQRLAIWLVGSQPLQLEFMLGYPGITPSLHCTTLAVGARAFVHLLDIHFDRALPCDIALEYDLLINGQGIGDWAPHLLYPGTTRPDLVLRERLDQVLHGSCRKPHHPAADGLLCADRLLAACTQPQQRPAVLLMTGDQVYADDVAGPMLRAIHELIERLGCSTSLEGAVVDRQRGALPATRPATTTAPTCCRRKQGNETLRERFFGGKRKPIFSSSNADNHLVTFAEVMAMYLLVWSPTPWALVRMDMPADLSEQRQARYRAAADRSVRRWPGPGGAGHGPPALPDDLRRPRHHRRLEPLGAVGTDRLRPPVLAKHHRQRAARLPAVPGLGQRPGCLRAADRAVPRFDPPELPG